MTFYDNSDDYKACKNDNANAYGHEKSILEGNNG